MAKHWMVRILSQTLTLASTTTTSASASFSFLRSLCSATSSATFALKNVTRSNFDSALGELRRLVREADFVAIDLEMTGVTSAPWRESVEFDRFDIHYLKVKDSAEKFAIIQFGVCPFRWDPSKASFIAHPHNFYVFPRQEIPVDGPCCEFLCQTTSIDFLAKYQFDFNMCIKEGVSYLSRGQEDEAMRRLRVVYEDEFCNLRKSRDTPVTRIADVLFTERMKNRISGWRNELLLNRNGGSKFQESLNNSSQQFQTVFFKMRPALLLNCFTTHQLKLIQLVTEKHFKDLVYVHAKGETSSLQQLIVYSETQSDRDLLMKEVKDGLLKEAETKIGTAVGFRHVIDLLSSAQKLLVGHNCFLDIAHIYSKFFGHLPPTAEEYVSSIHEYFPYIIDTKVLLNGHDVLRPVMKKNCTSLSKAFAFLCPEIATGVKGSGLVSKHHVKVEVQVDDMRSSNWNSGAKHEAGYDAFMTGCVFTQACCRMGFDLELNSSIANLAHDEKLRKYINLLYLSWRNGDIIDLTTGKRTSETSYCRYPKIIYSNIVLLWGFPKNLKTREIRECICKVFGLTSITSVYHLDETAVFIEFSKAGLVSDFLLLKDTLERNDNPISVLHPLSKILEGGNTHAATYKFYKRICASPISKVFFADQVEAVGIKWKTEPLQSNAEVETPESKNFGADNEMASFSITPEQNGSGKMISLINELARGRSINDHQLEDDEISGSSIPAQSQLCK